MSDNQATAVFVSDPHYRSEAADLSAFVAFLTAQQCQELCIVGDTLDAWADPSLRGFEFYWPAHWPKRKAILIHGNHDPARIGQPYVIHTTKTGERLLVIHGHQYDAILRWGPIGWAVSILGTRINEWIMQKMGFSLAALVADSDATRLKLYRHLAAMAVKLNCAGVVCGHTHVFDFRIVSVSQWAVALRFIRIYDCGCWLKDEPHGFWYEDEEGTIREGKA